MSFLTDEQAAYLAQLYTGTDAPKLHRSPTMLSEDTPSAARPSTGSNASSIRPTASTPRSTAPCTRTRRR